MELADLTQNDHLQEPGGSHLRARGWVPLALSSTPLTDEERKVADLEGWILGVS